MLSTSRLVVVVMTSCHSVPYKVSLSVCVPVHICVCVCVCEWFRLANFISYAHSSGTTEHVGYLCVSVCPSVYVSVCVCVSKSYEEEVCGGVSRGRGTNQWDFGTIRILLSILDSLPLAERKIRRITLFALYKFTIYLLTYYLLTSR